MSHVIDEENRRIGAALRTICAHRSWIPIHIESMATAGVRVFICGSENRVTIDMTQFDLVETLEQAAKELRGY